MPSSFDEFDGICSSIVNAHVGDLFGLQPHLLGHALHRLLHPGHDAGLKLQGLLQELEIRLLHLVLLFTDMLLGSEKTSKRGLMMMMMMSQLF